MHALRALLLASLLIVPMASAQPATTDADPWEEGCHLPRLGLPEEAPPGLSENAVQLLEDNRAMAHRTLWNCPGALQDIVQQATSLLAPVAWARAALSDVYGYDAWEGQVRPAYPEHAATVDNLTSVHARLEALSTPGPFDTARLDVMQGIRDVYATPDPNTVQRLQATFHVAQPVYANATHNLTLLLDDLAALQAPLNAFHADLPAIAQHIRDQWWCSSGCDAYVDDLEQDLDDALAGVQADLGPNVALARAILLDGLEADQTTMEAVQALPPDAAKKNSPGLPLVWSLALLAVIARAFRRT